MHIVILVVLGALLIFGPQLWARHVLKRYSVEQMPRQFTARARKMILLDTVALQHMARPELRGEYQQHAEHH